MSEVMWVGGLLGRVYGFPRAFGNLLGGPGGVLGVSWGVSWGVRGGPGGSGEPLETNMDGKVPPANGTHPFWERKRAQEGAQDSPGDSSPLQKT